MLLTSDILPTLSSFQILHSIFLISHSSECQSKVGIHFLLLRIPGFSTRLKFYPCSPESTVGSVLHSGKSAKSDSDGHPGLNSCFSWNLASFWRSKWFPTCLWWWRSWGRLQEWKRRWSNLFYCFHRGIWRPFWRWWFFRFPFANFYVSIVGFR